MNLKSSFLFGSICCVFLAACSTRRIEGSSESQVAYPDPMTSEYSLPFDSAVPRRLIQGNLEERRKPWKHYGDMAFAFDFEMPIGTTVKASRKGMVMFVRDEFSDEDHKNTHGNVMIILHEDGTAALYGHIKQHGALVRPHKIVDAGEPIALSGNSGESPTPHLHFQVNESGDFSKSKTIPISFRDAGHTERLIKGESYPERRQGER
jgi:murein DD-endopeptidase MepM/ murein hydrolase activator NlpD